MEDQSTSADGKRFLIVVETESIDTAIHGNEYILKLLKFNPKNILIQQIKQVLMKMICLQL